MSTGKAFVCKLPELREIEGADKIVQTTVVGETIIVSKDYHKGDIGILFDCETQLSHEFCHYNNLYRHSDLNFDKTKAGYIEDNRRVKPIRLKGVKVSAFWMPFESLRFAYKDMSDEDGYFHFPSKEYLPVGTQFNEVNGIEICKKYVSKKTQQQSRRKEGKSKADLVPTFKQHYDTDHFMRASNEFREGDYIIITEKVHGTSCRCGYLPSIKELSPFQKVWNSLAPKKIQPKTEYNFVVGSRRVVKSIGEEPVEGESYYNTDIWTKASKENFEGKLRKGETVYFEIVGYTPDGTPIMGRQSNKKLKSFMDKKEYKEFIERYGEETVFHYGCFVPTEFNNHRDYLDLSCMSKIFVYRITTTNEDGETIDYSWEQVKLRCEQMGVKYVPEIDKGTLVVDNESLVIYDKGAKWSIDEYVDALANSPSENFPQHLKEGVCVRKENGLISKTFKHKGYYFKVLEGIIKESDVVDMEDSN